MVLSMSPAEEIGEHRKLAGSGGMGKNSGFSRRKLSCYHGLADSLYGVEQVGCSQG